jgi:spore germination cell wall hydrolase CwlJ-like protein
VALATPTKQPVVQIVKVPVVKIIEKKVIVNKPVYLSKYDKKQIKCMAENTYFEAGHEPTKGKIAVNNVVLNRVKDKRFPKTPCAVINQRTARVCQFSWKCEGGKRIADMTAYRKATTVAENVYLGNYSDVTKGAKFYHADYVSPSWGRVFDRTTKIGAHIFYRG